MYCWYEVFSAANLYRHLVTFSMSIYVLLVRGFVNLDFYEARFKALLGEILVFSPFSRLYGLLDGFLSRIWSYLEIVSFSTLAVLIF